MCGIAGLLESSSRNSPEVLRDIVTRMADTLRHRGPDDSGAWVDADAGVALSMRRLAILDLSPAGHQPMCSSSGRYVIVFNGEIYNSEDLGCDLLAETPELTFRGHSDTEVMLASFDRWGVEQSVCRFNGMFAFAVWDRAERRLWLARDRMGEKPLYYGWIGKALLFASELKALRMHPDFSGEINRDALALFLRHNCVPAPYSIYRNISKLLPGCIASFDAQFGMKLRSYWSLKQVAAAGVSEFYRGSETDAIDQLDSLLKDSVRRRMVADVPVGVFLSGGIDSSVVTAIMQTQSTAPVRSFSIGFEELPYNEAEDAAKVARHLRTEHTELYVTPDEAMKVIPELSHYYDEPFADSSQIPTYLVSRLARQTVTVGLSGDGGDEVFAGYNRHLWLGRLWNRSRLMPRFILQLLAALVLVLPPKRWEQVLRWLEPVLPEWTKQRLPGDKLHKMAELLTSDNKLELYLGVASHWGAPQRLLIGASEPPTLITDTQNWPALSDFTELMIYLDTMTYLPDDILVKLDRASMAVSLEARVPLLDHRIVEFAWQLPMQMKIRDGVGKWVLRQVLKRYVPDELIHRPKMGFGLPLGPWLRGPLRDWAESLLSEQRLRQDGYFEVAPVRQRWSEHVRGTRNWSYHIWDVLMFQAWLQENRRSPEVNDRPLTSVATTTQRT